MNWSLFVTVLAALWAGFVLAISFMESWLKFRAPGVTLQAGLSIGNMVFRALNRVEWSILLVMVFAVFRGDRSVSPIVPVAILCVILFTQTFFLLPVLSSRAQKLISGLPVRRSGAHVAFIFAEIMKIFILSWICISAMA